MELLQIRDTFFITKCDTVYYKLRWIYYKLRQVLQSAMIITNCDSTRPYSLWSKGGAVVRALASHQCDPGSNPGVDAICGLSLLLVLSLASRGFSPGTLVFPSP